MHDFGLKCAEFALIDGADLFLSPPVILSALTEHHRAGWTLEPFQHPASRAPRRLADALRSPTSLILDTAPFACRLFATTNRTIKP